MVTYTSVLLWQRSSSYMLCTSVSINDVMFAHNVQVYITKKRALKVTLQVALEAAAGAESAVYDCLVIRLHASYTKHENAAYCYRHSVVCVCVCWTQPRAQRKQPNRLRCRLGHGIGTKEPRIRWRTDPLGEKTVLSGIF